MIGCLHRSTLAFASKGGSPIHCCALCRRGPARAGFLSGGSPSQGFLLILDTLKLLFHSDIVVPNEISDLAWSCFRLWAVGETLIFRTLDHCKRWSSRRVQSA